MWKFRKTAFSATLRRWTLTLCLVAVFRPWLWTIVRANAEGRVQSEPPAQRGFALKHAGPVSRESIMCGPNSLYMLLALNSVPVDYQVIEKFIPTHREGMSLAELNEASNALGLRSEVRHCSIDELRRWFDFPVIAHLARDIGKHYVIIVAMTDNTVTMLDGTTGERDKVTNQWLNKSWTGHVLVPAADVGLPWLVLEIFLFGSVLFAFFALKCSSPKGITRVLNR